MCYTKILELLDKAFSFIISSQTCRAYIVLTTTYWLIIEIVFYFYLRFIVLPELDNLTTPVQSIDSPWDQFHKTIDVVDDLKDEYNFVRFISGWFRNSKLEDVYSGNVRAMLGWALFSKDYPSLTVNEQARVEDVTVWLRMRYNVELPEGWNPSAAPIRLTLEPVEYIHRPLIFYVGLTAMQLIGHMVLSSMGFLRHEVNGIAYWFRGCPIKTPPEKRSQPLIFFHGISPGLNIYLAMVTIFAKNRKTVLVEVPHISMCLNFKAKRIEDMVAAVETICHRHRISEFSVAGHSFGSLCASWITKHLPDKVQQVILIDPVCVLLALPDVAFNFLHRTPTSIMEFILKYGGSSEITIHHALKRHFWWYAGQIFLDEIKCPVFFSLSGKDEIVPSAAIKEYIKLHHRRAHEGQGRCTDKREVQHRKAPTCNMCPSPLCCKHMVQCNYYDTYSHGTILFLPKRLKELDAAFRKQEKLYRATMHEAMEDDFLSKPELRRMLS